MEFSKLILLGLVVALFQLKLTAEMGKLWRRQEMNLVRRQGGQEGADGLTW